MNSSGCGSPCSQTACVPLAIVGIGCRFPGGAEDVDSFWQMLAQERTGIREVPDNRWNRDRYYHSDSAVPGTMVSKWGGFLDNLDMFDARFWGISPREALRMDPQQRWLLETAWEAIEDSGTPPARLRGTKTGVFVGIAANDYAGLQMPNFAGTDVHTNSGCTLSIASNRISYLLDLHGASVSVDTACSSALVAVWTACRSIWAGACEGALAGGVNAVITPHATIGFSKASMLSPTGECFAFDARANGYVRGEGAGIVYIKPLERAIADGDRIYAVIRAAVSNQDGHTSSMTVPGVEGQSELLRQAYREAGIAPARVVYMEAHGTGTPVGDPIEATALGRVLGEGRPANQPCLMGSVKTNIGHLEAGSGIAGLIKAALVLHKDMVPPNRNFKEPNPHIPFKGLGLEVVRELQPLPRQDGYAPVTAVNSFGFGGTNAHVVLEQAPNTPERAAGFAPAVRTAGVSPAARQPAQRPCLLPISARDEVALRRYVEAFRAFLTDPSLDLREVCYSAGERKEHHGHRLVVMGSDANQMRKRLGAWLRGQTDGIIAGRAAPDASAPVFVFTGQGAQWWGMGRELLEREPVFRKTVEEIDRLLRPLASWSLLEEMTRPESESNIDRTDIAQPAIFALQVGLAELWKSWGIEPTKVVGHSVGEVAAAYCAGIYSLEDAVKVIFHRSRLQNMTGGHGRMLAVGVSAAEARRAIGDHGDRVHIAVINSSNLVTLAGDTKPLEEIAARIEKSGKFMRWLRIDYAFHTHQMDPIRDELVQVLADLKPRAGHIPFISTVTAGLLSGERLTGDYWWKNVRQPVLFGPAIASMIRGGADTFLELGPHPALASSISDCLKEQNRSGAVFHSLRRKGDDTTELVSNLAGLHVRGVPINWGAVNQSRGVFVRLPRYPWNRESYWLESENTRRERLAPLEHPLLGVRVPGPKPTWQFELHPRRFAYLDDHRFWDSIVFPGACYAEMGTALARLLFADEPYAVEDLDIKKALFISEDQPPTVQVTFDPETKAFAVHSRVAGSEAWDLHAQGRLTRIPSSEHPAVNIEQLHAGLTDYFDHDRYYKEMKDAGYQFGPNFTQIRNVWRVHGKAVAEIVVPEEIHNSQNDYHIHPAVLDAFFHIFRGIKVDPDARPEDNFYLPQSIRRVHLYRDRPPAHLWAQGRLVFDDGKSLVCDIFAYDEHGERIADVLGFRVDKAEQKQTADMVENCYYQFRWEPRRLRGSRVAGTCGFPKAKELTATARSHVAELNPKHDLRSYRHDFAPRADALVCQAVQNAWLQLGWKPKAGDRVRAQELIDRLGIVEPYHRLARAQLRDLAKHGLLRQIGDDSWEVLQPFKQTDPSAAWQALAEEYPRFVSEVVLNQRTGPNLAGVMSGEIDPLELLFPKGSSTNLEKFYSEAADFPALLSMASTAVGKMAEGLPNRRVLRVLEIGAGTGSLTRHLLPVLPADRTEYLFTDVGPAFLTAAKKQFANYPFVEYRTFDIEKDPQGQGLPAGGFDLIVGSLVLHATADLKQVLTNLRTCLAPGGLLMFNEVFPHRHTWDNIFGLLSGWWRYTDTDLRRHSPLLERQQWPALMEQCGFCDPGAFGSFTDESESEQAFMFAFAPATSTEPAPTDKPARPYLVFADRSGIGNALATRLKQRGHRVIRLVPESEFKRRLDDEFAIRPDSETDIRRVLTELELPTPDLAGVVHCLSLDHPATAGLTLDGLRSAQHTGVLSALALIRALSDGPPEQTWFITRGVYADKNVASSPLVGLLRVARNEYYPSRFTGIDLDVTPRAEEIDDLLQEVTLGDDDREITYRGDRRHVLRLGRARAEELPVRTRNAVRSDGSVTPFRLQTSKPGILTNLSLNESRRRDPEPNGIEVRVRAGGINFRDVMKALGHYPGNPIDLLWFGDDVSGTVERVGKNVRHLKPGDAVAGMVPYCFRSYVTADARMVFKKPDAISFEEAATLPTVFLTAHYALNHLAHMQKGEKILIHAGSGGVGQAAIQIAKRLGLEIFATAGTPEKRELLKKMGVHHALNSRTLEFADQIMEITGGKGVDAVLNSLAGDFIPKSMSVLAPFGRFLEIGKIDIYKNSKLGLESLKNNISYFVIDLAQHLLYKPEFMERLFAELGEHFAAGHYQPLTHTVFPITQVVDAFRYMAQGKHVGKNVLSFDPGAPIPIGPCTESAHHFREDASYLITGGAGGFGLELAKWMSKHGARNLVLFSRSGPREDALREIESLRAQGINIMDARGDVTRFDDVHKTVQRIQAEMPPLKGVIHAAMVLDDDFIVNLDERRFLTALEPKMAGAWNLHVATKDEPLEHFICFSSLSSVVGVPKQSNYNAGNYFTEALVRYRHAHGLPALAINWGALLGAGFVERNRKTADFLDKIGLKAFSMEEATRVFGQLTRVDAIQVTASRVEWRPLSKACPNLAQAPTYAALTRESADADRGGSLVTRLQSASPDARLTLVEDFIVAQVAGVFGVTEEKVDRDTPLTNLGLDSLMAVELTNRMEREVGTSIPMGSLLGGPNIKVLAQTILRLASQSFTAVPGAEAPQSTAGELAPLERTFPAHDEFPLSQVQRTLSKTGANSPAFIAKIRPALDTHALRRAFAALMHAQPMLNATFHSIEGNPVQRLTRPSTLPFEEGDCRSSSEGQVKDMLRGFIAQPFDLQRGPLVRLGVFHVSDDAHVLALTAHPLIADSWSLTILVQSLLDNYSALTAGREPTLRSDDFSYEDFVSWESKYLAGPGARRLADFWKRHLKDAALDLNLPHAENAPVPKTYPVKLDEPTMQRALAFSAEQGMPLATTLLSEFQLVLHRWCHQEDLVVGFPFAGRKHKELSNIVGRFSRCLPIRSRVDDDPTFEEFLKRTADNVAAASEHQHYPEEQLAQDLGLSPDASLAQASFSLERAAEIDAQAMAAFLLGRPGHKVRHGGLTLESLDLPAATGVAALHLRIEEAEGNLYGIWEYDANVFDSAAIAKLNELFARSLRELAQHPHRRVSEFVRDGSAATNGVVRTPRKRALAQPGSNGQVDYTTDATLDSSFVLPDVPANPAAFDRVLLTGASGYLGAFVLDELLRETKAKVYCLVRAKNAKQGFDRIADNLRRYGLSPADLERRTVAVAGDLEKPLLGLSEAEFNRLAAEIDVIYHGAAVLNLVAPYERLRPTNVNGTREILRLALRTKAKPVHYISTFGVLATSDRHAQSIATEDEPLPPFEKLPVGYTRTKWVCETLMQQARSRGLPVTIYRPGNISGHSETGVCNDQDFLHTLVLACSRIRAVPRIDLEADATPVDYVSRAIVYLSRRPDGIGGTYHLVNPQPLRLPQLVEWLRRTGVDVELVPYSMWYKQLGSLVNGATDEDVAPLMGLLGPIDIGAGETPRNWHPKYDCRHAVSKLAGAGIVCPPTDDQLLNTYLQYMLRSGLVGLEENGNGRLRVSIPSAKS